MGDFVDEFLARERENLKDFGEELKFNDRTNFNNVDENEVSGKFDDKQEFIKKWAIAFQKRIEMKDAAEREQILKLEEQGLQDLHEWGAQYRNSLARGIKLSRTHNDELMETQVKVIETSSSLANADASQSVLWDQICQLCNFTTCASDGVANDTAVPISSRHSQRDSNRMRALLLQLKKNPPSLPYAKAH